MERSRTTYRLALLIALAFTVGCGSGYDLAPVEGTVSIDGAPYPGGKVIFSPVAEIDATEAGRAAFGIPDETGRYELSTVSPGDGAVVGQHRVTLFRAANHDDIRPDLRGLSFRRVNLTGGNVTVSSSDNVIDIEFTSDEIQRSGNRL